MTPMLEDVAPTLATACAALPPEGVRFALGRPGGETVAPTLALAHACRRCQALGRVKVWMPWVDRVRPTPESP